MKRILSIMLCVCLVLGMAACGKTQKETVEPSTQMIEEAVTEPAQEEPEQILSNTQKILVQAQTMTLAELAKKAVEESNGGVFCGIGDTPKGRDALEKFIDYLQTVDSSYTMTPQWLMPDSSTLVDAVCADSVKRKGEISMAMVACRDDVARILLAEGKLHTFQPSGWAEAVGADENTRVALEIENHVFLANATGKKLPVNFWDFVKPDAHGLCLELSDSVQVKNFLCMLTRSDYSAWVREAYSQLSEDEKAYFDPYVRETTSEAADLGLGSDGVYALAWIRLWVESYLGQPSDNRIVSVLANPVSTNQFGLAACRELQNLSAISGLSADNLQICANTAYQGIGGFGSSHYLYVADNAPMPWTACAFIAYLTQTVDGFSPWGMNLGCYAVNPQVDEKSAAIYQHSANVEAKEDPRNDLGLSWWTEQGKMVREDPDYCESVARTVGSWICVQMRYVEETLPTGQK